MAELTHLDEKLAEVLGLAQAAQTATRKVATLARQENDTELLELLERMGDEAAEVEERCDDAAGSSVTASRPRSPRRRAKPKPRSTTS